LNHSLQTYNYNLKYSLKELQIQKGPTTSQSFDKMTENSIFSPEMTTTEVSGRVI